MLKRTLSLVLAFVMVFSLLLLNALAEEPGTDEIEELLLDTSDVPEEEAETTAPIETESETEAVETEAPTVPETVPATVPETVPATVPETEPDTTIEPDSETTEETVQGEKPAELLTPAAQAAGGTWTLGEKKQLDLPSGLVCSPSELDSFPANHTFTFTPDHAGRYIFCWDNSQNRGNGPHVVVQGENVNSGGNVYNAFPGAEGKTYTIKVYAMADESYEAELWLTKSTTNGSISFGEARTTAAQGEHFWLSVERGSFNYLSGDVTFTSDNEACLRVETDAFSVCELEAVGPGTATITATDANGSTTGHTITVVRSEPLALNATKSVYLEPDGEAFYSFTAPGNYNYTFWDQNNNGFRVEIPLNEVDTAWSYGSIQFAGSKGTAYLIHVANDTEEPQNNPHYQPTKPTAIALALALELNLEQTRDLIGRAGYALANSSKFDVIIMYFIREKNRPGSHHCVSGGKEL